MRRVLFVTLLLSTLWHPSIGQVRYIEKSGETYNALGVDGIGDLLFRYRNTYGRYPKDKKDLLDFLLDKDRYDGVDSLYYHNYLTIRNKDLSKEINGRKNKLTVSGDTCLFFNAREKSVTQCIGGSAELQKEDSYRFRFWIGSFFFDKRGKCLWPLSSESPFIPEEVNRQFCYVVTMEPRISQPDLSIPKEDPGNWAPPVFVPITMTRSGAFSYDVSCLEGIQLFYQERCNPFESTYTIGRITIEEAIDPAYLDAIRAYMKDFFKKHEEVESVRLWEQILLNNPPDGV